MARKKEILEESFAIDEVLDDLEWTPRYNVAPWQTIPVVRQDAAGCNGKPARRLSQMHWGLIPHWAQHPALGHKMINARSETVADRPAFCEALRRRRCLIPADGFYEWKREGKRKIPYCFTLADDAVFGLAGLWDLWRGPNREIVESCTILTTEANELLREVHDRMPVLLAPEAYDEWLDPRTTHVEPLRPLLKPFPASRMRGYRVSSRVNNVIHDDAQCAAEVEASPQLAFDDSKQSDLHSASAAKPF